MRKGFKVYFAIWALLFVLFNVIAFVVPNHILFGDGYDKGFWIGYAFIVVAFIGQLFCGYLALKADSLRKLFYNIPLITVSYTGLFATAIFGLITMFLPFFPTWIGALICVVILVGTAIAVIMAKTSSDVVSNIDDKIKANTLFIKTLTSDSQALLDTSKNQEINKKSKEVFEKIRYSDPMSNDGLSGIEAEIQVEFSDFRDAVMSESIDGVNKHAKKLIILLDSRNNRCKLLKS